MSSARVNDKSQAICPIYCIVAGDINNDFSRHKSGNTVSLNTFIDNEGLYSVIEEYKQKIITNIRG